MQQSIKGLPWLTEQGGAKWEMVMWSEKGVGLKVAS